MSKQTDLLNLTDAITVDSSNNVGIGGDLTVGGSVSIGTTTASSSSDVKQVMSSSNGAFTQYSYNGGAGGVVGSADVGYLDFFTYTGNIGSETYTRRMTIDSSGNVGIGTSSPSTASHVKDGNGGLIQTIEAGDSNSAYTKYINSTTGSGAFTDGLLVGLDTDESATFWLYESNHMKFGTAGIERMRIEAGQTLVGATSLNAIAGGSTAGCALQAAGTVWGSRQNDVGGHFNRYSSNGAVVSFAKEGITVGSVSVTPSATAYNTSSDYRLKTDAQPMTGASARVQALKPVNFEWIADGTRVDGFLAHEAQEVVPEAVTGAKDAMRDEEYEVTPAVYEDVVIPAVLDEEGNELEAERTEQRLVSEAVMGTRSVPDYQGIDQSKLVPLLTAALQEALTEIADLKARVTALEAV